MKTIVGTCTFLLLSTLLLFLSACGTTAVMESHPSLAQPGEGNAAKVYFLRPDIGYRGVMKNAFSIALNDKELLTLANGEYALVYLRSVSGVVTVEFSAIRNNVQTRAKESRPFSFEAGNTYYLAFQARQPGSVPELLFGGGISYVPILVTAAEALTAANVTKPVGRAIQDPIAPSK
jgi:hypothetical protein